MVINNAGAVSRDWLHNNKYFVSKGAKDYKCTVGVVRVRVFVMVQTMGVTTRISSLPRSASA